MPAVSTAAHGEHVSTPNLNAERPLRDRLLAELADAPDGLSLPRLCKRLGVRMSVLLREIAWLGDEPIGDVPGAGLVHVRERGELRIAMLTPAGRQLAGVVSDRHAN
jgi:hypothetical protein